MGGGTGGLCTSLGELTITQDNLCYTGCTSMWGSAEKGQGTSDGAGYRCLLKEVV